MTATLRELNEAVVEHLEDCSTYRQQNKLVLDKLVLGHTAIETAIKNFQALAWKAFVSLVGIVATAAITLITQSYVNNTQVATKAEMASKMANRYTREDAMRDKADAMVRERELRKLLEAR